MADRSRSGVSRQYRIFRRPWPGVPHRRVRSRPRRAGTDGAERRPTRRASTPRAHRAVGSRCAVVPFRRRLYGGREAGCRFHPSRRNRRVASVRRHAVGCEVRGHSGVDLGAGRRRDRMARDMPSRGSPAAWASARPASCSVLSGRSGTSRFFSCPTVALTASPFRSTCCTLQRYRSRWHGCTGGRRAVCCSSW